MNATSTRRNDMRCFILGATGKTGTQLLDLALHNGHTVTAFVRSPRKLNPDRPGLTGPPVPRPPPAHRPPRPPLRPPPPEADPGPPRPHGDPRQPRRHPCDGAGDGRP